MCNYTVYRRVFVNSFTAFRAGLKPAAWVGGGQALWCSLARFKHEGICI